MYLKKIVLIIVLIGLVAMAGFAYYVYSNVFVANTAFNNEVAHVYIPTGATFTEVKAELEPLISDMDSFETVASKKGYTSNIKAGHYLIAKGMNNNDIVNAIRSGNTPIQVKFNNQERLENLAGHISRQIEPDSLQLLASFRNTEFLKKSGFNDQTAIGMFIPNTYEVYWNTSADAFRDKMLKEYNRFWTKARNEKAEKLGLTRDQVMALASVVQKETAKIDERPRVAGVYMNRLNTGMLLQADPTVIYAKKQAENDFQQVIKRVLYKDLELDSKYNTYKYAGVPPGPISMPDVTSIDAVLNYEKHDYYYFVADVTNFGYHKFAKSLAQHNVNKAAYVRWVNENGVNR